MRRCPACGGDLEPFVHSGVELDRCRDCRGAWFDQDELQAVLRGPASRPSAFSVLLEESLLEPRDPTGQTCPACETPSLHRVIWGDVVAATCISCHGFWITGAAIALLRKQLAARSPPGPDFDTKPVPVGKVAADVVSMLGEILLLLT